MLLPDFPAVFPAIPEAAIRTATSRTPRREPTPRVRFLNPGGIAGYQVM
jgi:hypothetical protein